MRVIAEWATRCRNEVNDMPRKCPFARILARLMTSALDQLSRQEAILVAAIDVAVPALVAAVDLIQRIHGMIQRRQSSEPSAWIEQAAGTALASFTNGLRADQDAFTAALSSAYSAPARVIA